MVFRVAVGWFVGIGAERVAEIKTVWVGPEGWVDDLNVFLADFGWVVTVVLVETFFERVVHGVDGGFSVFVTSHGVEIGFLDEK